MAVNTGQGTRRVGEVIEASTGTFTAQCYHLYEAPPLGALVRTGGDTPIYGVVGNISTQSIDPGRRPIARGEDEETEEGVYQSHPQLSRLMRTDFQAIVLGFNEGDAPRHYLPPLPPRIHAFVYDCPQEEIYAFTQTLDFMPLFLDSRLPAQDQVIAAFLIQASAAHPQSRTFW